MAAAFVVADVKLSLLDRSRTRLGRPDGEALHRTIDRARSAERLGYHRFWVAEHHGVPGVASGAPGVLLAAVGAATSTIRIGSGGVMLPHHQPFVVAEQFRMLEALHPGRVDLGLGRSPGFTAPVRAVLREDGSERDRFADDVEELRDHLTGTGPVTVRPAGGVVPMFVLATGAGVQLAARLGLPVVLGGPAIHDDGVSALLSDYRSGFRPAAGTDGRPLVILSLDVVVADTREEARELALPEAWAMATARRTGAYPPLESPAQIRARPWPDQVRRRVENSLDRAMAGPPDTVRRRIDALLERTDADELLLSTSTWDHEALLALDAAALDLLH